MRVAIYARVSTLDRGQTCETQLGELREYCANRKWSVVAEYCDRGISGAKQSRPQLDAMMADARRRKFDAVLVWRFDRFARSVQHLLAALEEFKALDVHFVSLTEAIDTSTPTGKMVFTVLGAVAELERSLIVERVKSGMKRAKREGIHVGRPRAEVDLRAAKKMLEGGKSLREVAEKFGVSASYLCKARRA
jgi:DNA invertase Pin-like site-specific DNA recombinase